VDYRAFFGRKGGRWIIQAFVAGDLEMLAFILAVSAGAGQAASSAVHELEEIQRQLGRAWLAGDCATIDRIYGQEWSVTHIHGNVLSRADVMKMCTAPERRMDSLSADDISVRLYGDTAVVTGRTIAKVGEATIRLRFTDVFVRRDGRWQAVASHATSLDPLTTRPSQPSGEAAVRPR
jgi:hypothetical protein